MLNKVKKFIKQNYIFISIGTIVICLYQYNNKFVEIFEKLCIIVVIVCVSLVLLYILYKSKMNKSRIKKISQNDYNYVKKYYERNKTRVEFNDDNYEVHDYLRSIEYLCSEFLSGEKTIYIEKKETTFSNANIELTKQIKHLGFDVNEINKILEIIYKYYDDNGNEIEINTGKTMICVLKEGDSFEVDGAVLKSKAN